MKLIFGAACALAVVAATPALAQDYGGYYQDQQRYDQQRRDYEYNRDRYQERMDQYRRSREQYETNRDAYRENYDNYRRQYHRWARGEYVPEWYRNRWGTIPNWSYYHLYRPRWGYSWVFDGQSYLLVDNSTGYVADVVGPWDPNFTPYYSSPPPY